MKTFNENKLPGKKEYLLAANRVAEWRDEWEYKIVGVEADKVSLVDCWETG